MDYREMQGAVMDAYRRHDYDRCFSILDEFIEAAGGEELGKALSLKASAIHQIDKRRSPEALVLAEEALHLLREDHGELLRTVVSALGVCYIMGDVERAATYAFLGYRLLQDHGDDPGVRASQFRLYLNLGLISKLRGDYPTAYWHFVQGTHSLLSGGSDDDSDIRNWLFWLNLHTSNACLYMGREPEAREALDRANEYAATEEQRLRVTIAQAELLQHWGRAREAADLMDSLDVDSAAAWSPGARCKYFLVRALAAQYLNDLRGFHQFLSSAHNVALQHSLDFLLCDIQRAQRNLA